MRFQEHINWHAFRVVGSVTLNRVHRGSRGKPDDVNVVHPSKYTGNYLASARLRRADAYVIRAQHKFSLDANREGEGRVYYSHFGLQPGFGRLGGYKIGQSQKPGDEAIGRLMKYLLGGPDLFNIAHCLSPPRGHPCIEIHHGHE